MNTAFEYDTNLGNSENILSDDDIFKSPFCDLQPHFLTFSKKVEILVTVDAFWYVMFAWKMFLADLFVW